MDGAAQATPGASAPPPGVTLTPLAPAASGPPPGVTLTPLTPSAAPATPPAATPPQDNTLTGNPNNEGTYEMKGPNGDLVKVPYSKVGTIARNQGYQLIGGTTWYGAPTGENARYLKDYSADPNTIAQTTQFAHQTQDPGQGVEIGAARGAALTAAGLAHIVRKVTGTTGSTTKAEKGAQEFGEGSDTGAEDAGKFMEGVGEFLMGDEALKSLSYVDKLKQVMPALKVIEKSPLLARIVDVAMRQGAVAGAQTFAKTGGDPTAAGESAAGTALFTPLAEGIASRFGSGGTAAIPAPSGAERYAAEARGAVEPQLRAVDAAINAPSATGAPGAPPTSGSTETALAEARGAVEPQLRAVDAAINAPSATGAPGAPPTSGSTETALAEAQRGVATRANLAANPAAQAAAAKATNSFNVDDVLNTIHDFNGAKDRLAQVAAPMYDAIDHVTGGKFRELNAEVAAAQKAVYKSVAGTPERAAAEKLVNNKQAEMNALIDSTKGTVSPEIVRAAKSAFRQSYLLDDFATIWDRNLDGVPGNSKASAGQRGINGKGLLRDLTSAVNRNGRPFIESVLGPGRLDNLEQIANENNTITKKIAFGQAVRNVARNMAHGAIVGGLTGETLGGDYHTGAAVGAAAVGLTYVPDVLRAIAADPKIGQQLTFAVRSGARPGNYAPLIANMIQTAQQKSHQEDQQP